MMPITVRATQPSDDVYLLEWFKEPGVLQGFPMQTEIEVKDSVQLWMNYVGQGAGLTALIGSEVAGMIVLYVNPFQKLAHTSLFSIIVNPKFRRQGVASVLIKELEKIAKEKFHIEILHLEVYEGNLGAYKLYENLGFKRYGEQKKFIKENGHYASKVFMQKEL